MFIGTVRSQIIYHTCHPYNEDLQSTPFLDERAKESPLAE